MSENKLIKKQKLQEKIVHDANLFLRQSMKDPRLSFVSFTKADLYDDLSHVKVYWDSFDTSVKAKAKEAIVQTRGRLRTFLAKSLKLRHVPTIHFIEDSTFEDQKKIENLLNS